MDKKKILSSLALAGILTAGVLGANVNATTAEEYLKPVGVYKKLIDGETVVPYVLKGKNMPVKVQDIKSHFTNLELVNGAEVSNTNLAMGTGKTFKADGIDYKLVVYGDVTGDGKISTMDALAVQKAVVTKQEMAPIIKEAADVKNDGKISTIDALAIQKYVVNKSKNVIDKLPESAPVFVGIKDGQKLYAKKGDTTFKLPKVTITDNAKFEMEGNYDINVDGEYEITYLAEGSLGNETKATITVVVDGTAPTVTTDYNIKTSTNQNVTATINSNEELQKVEGWTLSVDKKSMTKEYEENITENVTVRDLAGNELTVTITIANIDKEAPVVNGVEDGKFYKSVTPSFVEGVATLQKDEEDPQIYTSNTTINQDGKYILVVTDAAGNKTTINFTIDTVAPVFETLAPITLKKGDVLPTVIAHDEVNGDIEPSLVIKFSNKTVEDIDTTGENDGTYTVTYTALDEAGNKKTATRRVTVDATPATVVDLQKSTESVAKDVIMRVEFNEKMQEVEGWTRETSQMAFTKKYTESVNEEIEFKDLAGNITPVTIKLDNINALAAVVSYSSTKLTNKNVKATITALEEMQEVEGWTLSENKKSMTKEYEENITEDVTVCDLAGNKAVITVKIENIDKVEPELQVAYSNENPTNESVTVTITSNKELARVTGWTLSKDKKTLTRTYTENVPETTVKVKDLAGNLVDVQIEITNIDKEAPVATVAYSTKNPTRENVIVTITADEELQEVEGWTLSEDKKSITKEYKENTAKAETVTITDLAGNTVEIKNIQVKNIDKDAPVVTGLTDGVTSYQTVTLTFTDKNTPITATLQKGTDEVTPYTEGTEISDNGTYKLVVKDNVGNEKTIIFRIDNSDVTIDGVENGKAYKTVAPTFTEGVGQLSILDEADNVISTSLYTSGEQVEEDGIYVLEVTNAAGKVTSVKFIIDNVAPTFTNIKENNTYKSITPRVDEKVVTVTLKKDGEEVETYTSLKAISEEGNYELTVVDEAGNTNTVNFAIDNTFKGEPKVTYSNNGKPTGKAVLVTITAEEKIVAPTGWTLLEDGMTITKLYDANFSGDISIKDLAGNTKTVTLDVKVTNP